MCAAAAALATACRPGAMSGATASQAPDPAAVAAAMAPQPESVSRVHFIKVKAGMDARFIQGAKAHIEWHRKMKDPWVWTAFYVETGPDTGTYGWVTQGRKWADFDAFDATLLAGDNENVGMTMGPYIDSHRMGMSVGLPNFSNPSAPGATFPLVSVEHFTVYPHKRVDFMVAISRAHAALQAGGFKPNYSWSVQVSGNEGLVFNLTLPRANWAGMADDPSFMRIMNEQLGEAGAAALFQSFDEATITSHAWTARILPDLSYTPGG
jgi:hypothetical protein